VKFQALYAKFLKSMAATPIAAYEAFISYRHLRRDRKWAVWLHRNLERYRTAKPLVAAGTRARFDRVFRDNDELPASGDLTEAIRDALRRSKYLIVVCSRRTPQSQWVNAEVEYFAKLGRQRSILILLIEGEPSGLSTGSDCTWYSAIGCRCSAGTLDDFQAQANCPFAAGGCSFGMWL
jgi:hypothetical protein